MSTVVPKPIPVDEQSIAVFVSAAKDTFLQLQKLSRMAELLSKGPGKVSDLCELLVSLRDMKDLLDSPVKEIGKLEQSLAYSRLPEVFDEQDLSSQTTASGIRTTLTSRVGTSVVDAEKMMQWLRDNELESLIKPTVNSSSLAAAVREYKETYNKEPPADAIKVTVTPYISVTKIKGKAEAAQ